MATISLFPLAGMNNVDKDDELQRGGDSPRLYVRDAVNIDISPSGRPSMRDGLEKVSAEPLVNLWRSSLHGDTFGTLADKWVKVDSLSWAVEVLATIGIGDVSHMILNSAVCVAGPEGLFTYDGSSTQRLTIDTPPAPMVMAGAGSMVAGSYGVAIAWLRGSVESGLSSVSQVDVPPSGGLDVIFPYCQDPLVTHVRLYLTRPDGGELARGEDYPITSLQVFIPVIPSLGTAPQFRHCDPIPTGRFIGYWRGRLLTAKGKVLRFSEAMAFHIHNNRHGFVQFPQRITFLMPVDGGIWVGQVDHVVFLQGSDPASLELQRKHGRAPVSGSAIYLDADSAGEYDQGGAATVIWLADNGYVAGTASGQIIENNAGTLRGITGQSGTSVVLGDRIITALI